MWIYEKKLEYPVKIKTCNPRMAKYIITQYGGPDLMFLYKVKIV
jgi:spore coat protein JC